MKNLLIIGGASGIGKELAHTLHKSGDKVFATYFKNSATSPDIQYHFMDVTSEEMDFSFLPQKIDGIAYCPGTINLMPFHRTKSVDFADDYKLQVIGAVKVIQALLPRLKASNNASVVFFSTVAVQTGFSFHSLVSASKGAIEGLTRALAAELAPGIRVNAIAPSITDTPLAEKYLNSEEKKKANAARHPLKKIGSPRDIAEMAAFLLSDKSSWITGQILHVDGGISSIKP